MAVKWIVTDMDGTLLNENDEIMPLTKQYLLKAQQRGIKLIFASGRSYSRLMPYARELEMEKYNGYLIEINGIALSRLQQGEREIFGGLGKTDIQKLFPFLQTLEVEIQSYQDKSLFYWIPQCQIPLKEAERLQRKLSGDYPWSGGAWSWVTDTRKGYPEQRQIYKIEEIPERLNKFGCLAAPERMEEVYRILMEKYGDSYEFVRTCPRLIEISPKGITKGNTLRRCMEKEGINPEEVIVFGDGENDVDMFRQVKYSIAMGNAENFVKEQAFDVTGRNSEEGMAAALRKYVKLEEPDRGRAYE